MDTFEQIVAPLASDLDPTDDLDVTVYGIRVLLFRVGSDERRSIIIPWHSYSHHNAIIMRHKMMHDPHAAAVTLAWFCLNFQQDPEDWLITAARIARLAEIPF